MLHNLIHRQISKKKFQKAPKWNLSPTEKIKVYQDNIMILFLQFNISFSHDLYNMRKLKKTRGASDLI